MARRGMNWAAVSYAARFLLSYQMNTRMIAAIVGVHRDTLVRCLRQSGDLPPSAPRQQVKKSPRIVHRVPPTPCVGAPIGEGAIPFVRAERERVAEYIREQQAVRRKVLTAAEREQIAAENRAYIPLTKRVPARGVRGWAATAPLSMTPDRGP